MTPEDYEHHVANLLRSEGWEASVTPHQRDHGVDIVAERGGERMAVQAKMFGGSNRPVNAQVVMELYGAAAYADCANAMIATDGRVLPDAKEVAAKLGVAIRIVSAAASDAAGAVASGAGADSAGAPTTFGEVWQTHVVPLAGTTLTRASGQTNDILRVDDGGIERRTSSGRNQYIRIEIFRWAIEQLLAGATVTREQINDRYTGRASSGIMLILGEIPLFETAMAGHGQVLRARRLAGS
jgi:hypothetical protein